MWSHSFATKIISSESHHKGKNDVVCWFHFCFSGVFDNFVFRAIHFMNRHEQWYWAMSNPVKSLSLSGRQKKLGNHMLHQNSYLCQFELEWDGFFWYKILWFQWCTYMWQIVFTCKMFLSMQDQCLARIKTIVHIEGLWNEWITANGLNKIKVRTLKMY